MLIASKYIKSDIAQMGPNPAKIMLISAPKQCDKGEERP